VFWFPNYVAIDLVTTLGKKDKGERHTVMADQEKLKRILHENLRPGKQVTDHQLTEVVERITELDQVNESQIRQFASEIIRDPNAFILKAVDMSDINNELKK
jgi:hypothetical protein